MNKPAQECFVKYGFFNQNFDKARFFGNFLLTNAVHHAIIKCIFVVFDFTMTAPEACEMRAVDAA